MTYYARRFLTNFEIPKPVKEIKVKKPINKVSPKRKAEDKIYASERIKFLAKNTVCPVTGQPTTEIHRELPTHGRADGMGFKGHHFYHCRQFTLIFPIRSR